MPGTLKPTPCSNELGFIYPHVAFTSPAVICVWLGGVAPDSCKAEHSTPSVLSTASAILMCGTEGQELCAAWVRAGESPCLCPLCFCWPGFQFHSKVRHLTSSCQLLYPARRKKESLSGDRQLLRVATHPKVVGVTAAAVFVGSVDTPFQQPPTTFTVWSQSLAQASLTTQK